MEDKDTEMVDVENEMNPLRSKVYQGLLFVEGLRNVKDQTSAEYFITFEGFWNECQETTEISISNVFNYLKVTFLAIIPHSMSIMVCFVSVSTAISGHLR
jgi:hypothetical protein